MISFVNSSLEAFPPTSLVRTFKIFIICKRESFTFPSLKTKFNAFSMSEANNGNPMCFNIMTELKSKAVGFANFLPTISEPVCFVP